MTVHDDDQQPTLPARISPTAGAGRRFAPSASAPRPSSPPPAPTLPAKAAEAAPRSRRGRGSKTEYLNVPTVIGEVLLTIGVILVLFVGYEAFWTNIKSGQLQSAKDTVLAEQWAQPVNPRSTVEVPLGDAFARLYIPSFGSDFRYAILSGTTDPVLEAGPGHYVDSQMPGQPGNFAVAGHRVGKGAPFNDLGLLKTCDPIVIETPSTWEIYRVLPTDDDQRDRAVAAADCLDPTTTQRVTTGEYAGVQGRFITTPDDIQAISPIPGTPNNGAQPEMLPLITLTTCHPQFSNAQRMIVHGVLVRSQPKSQGMPTELAS